MKMPVTVSPEDAAKIRHALEVVADSIESAAVDLGGDHTHLDKLRLLNIARGWRRLARRFRPWRGRQTCKQGR